MSPRTGVFFCHVVTTFRPFFGLLDDLLDRVLDGFRRSALHFDLEFYFRLCLRLFHCHFELLLNVAPSDAERTLLDITCGTCGIRRQTSSSVNAAVRRSYRNRSDLRSGSR